MCNQALLAEPPGRGCLVVHLAVQGYAGCDALDEILADAAAMYKCVARRAGGVASMTAAMHAADDSACVLHVLRLQGHLFRARGGASQQQRRRSAAAAARAARAAGHPPGRAAGQGARQPVWHRRRRVGGGGAALLRLSCVRVRTYVCGHCCPCRSCRANSELMVAALLTCCCVRAGAVVPAALPGAGCRQQQRRRWWRSSSSAAAAGWQLQQRLRLGRRGARWSLPQLVQQVHPGSGTHARSWLCDATLLLLLLAAAVQAGDADWAAPCEVCGRTYPHEHVRAIYGSTQQHGSDDDEDDR